MTDLTNQDAASRVLALTAELNRHLHAYHVLDIAPVEGLKMPEPKAVETFAQLSEPDRLRFAERVLKWRES